MALSRNYKAQILEAYLDRTISKDEILQIQFLGMNDQIPSLSDMGGNEYSKKSLAEVLHNAVRNAGIKKPVTPHWLRHSYATHLLENGTDLRFIKDILGHNSSRTTEIYTHISKKKITEIRSLFDDL